MQLTPLFCGISMFLAAIVPAAATDAVKIEGTAGAVSQYPAPETAPYADCTYTFLLTVSSQESGEALPEEIIVVAPIFMKRVLIKENVVAENDKLQLELTEFDQAPAELRQLQRADDIDSFDIPYYFLNSIRKIDSFNPKWRANYLPPELPELKKPPAFPFFSKLPAAEAAREQTMAADLNFLRKKFAASGAKSWDEWADKVEPLRKQYAAKTESRWVGDTYFKSGGWAFSGSFADTESFRNSVIQMDNYLKKRNIDLIVLRIPGRAEICADFFMPEMQDNVVNPVYYQLQEYLLENNVEYIDLTNRMVQERCQTTAPYWYIESGEGHAAEGGCLTIVNELADRLQRYNLSRNLPASVELATIPGMYNYPAGNPKFNPADPIPVTVVRNNGKALQIAEDGQSEVLLMGDSYFTHPTMREGGTIQHYFAWKTGVIPDLLCRMSAGSGLPRFLSRKGDEYLAPRRVIIWVTKPDTVFKTITPFEEPVYFESREVLEVFQGEKLAGLNFSAPDGLKHNSFYTPENGGEFKIVPLKLESLAKDGSGEAGILKFNVEAYRNKYKYILVGMSFSWNWTVSMQVNCGNYSDHSYLSLSDYSRKVDFLVPLSPDASTLEFNFKSVKVLRGLTLSIKKITLFGVN